MEEKRSRNASWYYLECIRNLFEHQSAPLSSQLVIVFPAGGSLTIYYTTTTAPSACVCIQSCGESGLLRPLKASGLVRSLTTTFCSNSFSRTPTTDFLYYCSMTTTLRRLRNDAVFYFFYSGLFATLKIKATRGRQKGHSSSRLTEYKIGVQPSMLTHWKTVNMANPMLSKDVIPWLGPVHFSKHIDVSGSQVNDPIGDCSIVPGKQGLAAPPSKTNWSGIHKISINHHTAVRFGRIKSTLFLTTKANSFMVIVLTSLIIILIIIRFMSPFWNSLRNHCVINE